MRDRREEKMSYKRYMLFRLFGIMAVAFLAAWATTTGHLPLMIPVVIVIATILFFLRRRVKEVVIDERVNTVAYKATRFAYLTFVILAVIAGAVFISLGRMDSPELFGVGLTLAYAVCGLLVLYWLGFIYYNKKLGGGE
jgi:uncharacterized membrane protein